MTREYTISRVNYKPVKAKDKKEVERERYEFAKGFLRSYDNALKRIMRGEKGRSARDLLSELRSE